MRYMMLLSGTNPSTPPPPELFEAIMKLGGEATEAGVLLDTAGLLPSVSGARVSLAGGKVTVTDGPFTESKEMISYALYEVRSKEEAIEWASRFIKVHRDHWARLGRKHRHPPGDGTGERWLTMRPRTPRSRRYGESSRPASSRPWPGSPGTWAWPRSSPRTRW